MSYVILKKTKDSKHTVLVNDAESIYNVVSINQEK